MHKKVKYLSGLGKTMPEHYVKISTGKAKIWLKVQFCPKSIQDFEKTKILKGTAIKSGKAYSFSLDDVIAYYRGNLSEIENLGMSYIPAADVCTILDTVVPDSMGYETHISARIVEIKVNKPLNEYVAEKLKYTELELCRALSAEQVDAVAMAIYNIEEKNQGMIIGDQTGIGKGRVAAAMIRYGVKNGLKPIFISEKPNLFTDIYRDLADIGSSNLVPFIVNSREAKTAIKDKEGNIVYQAPEKKEQESILKSQKLPTNYNFICTTYSQFSSSDKKPVKPMFISKMAKSNLVIMDESHNASGTSKTGEFLQSVIEEAKGVVFLSATFAKRPDNMPIYALKTAMSEANMSKEDLVEAIKKGGVALQEVLASQLVAEGQMLRRERSFEGVEVNYITLTEKENEHRSVFDNITSVLRDIIKFQEDYISEVVTKMDKIAAAEGKEVEERKGTKKAGVDNQPYFSKVFQVVNQILFSLKAKSVAELAIQRLDEGKKPVIAFSSTMETFLEELGSPGDTIDIDFRTVLYKGLSAVMKYTVIDTNETRTQKEFTPQELGPEAWEVYQQIVAKINSISTGISLSPIDIIKNTIRNAGYTCDEVTGRRYEVQMIKDSETTGVLLNRKKILANDAFRMFNNNELDCLMINQSGSTGASAHAIVTDKVPADKVKQRVMLVLQPELDINREVQKRGRINRTGQILKPIYDYVSSAIPAEKRLMMMLRKKLKSLDANTTSNQKQSDNILEVEDFLNRYGDKIVTEYLFENPELNKKLDNPLKLEGSNDIGAIMDGAASKVSGRVAVLSIKEQEEFYNEIIERYADYENLLKQQGLYDLEVEAQNLEAETIDKTTVIQGRDGASVFAQNTYLEKCEVNVLKKPFTKEELENLINSSLQGENAKQLQETTIENAKSHLLALYEKDKEAIVKKYEKLIKEIVNEKAYAKATDKALFVRNRTKELEDAKEESLKIEQSKANGKYTHLIQFLQFFYIGRALNYPTHYNEYAKAITLGINIDSKKPNPYAPSAIKIKIAIANSDKLIELPLSGDSGKLLLEIMGASSYMRSGSDEEVVENWADYTKSSTANRKETYIVTGNLLQGYAEYGTGKLISYTLKDGGISKGILLPDNFDPTKEKNNFVTVPFSKALDYILDMSENASVTSPDGKIILNYYAGYNDQDYYLSVPANKNFKYLYQDEKLIKMSNNFRDGFENRSDRFIAYYSKRVIKDLVSYLDDKHGVSILLAQSVYEKYAKKTKKIANKSSLIKQAEEIFEQDKKDFEARKNIESVITKQISQSSDDKAKRIRIAKAKAKAKLKYLELATIKTGLNGVVVKEVEIVDTGEKRIHVYSEYNSEFVKEARKLNGRFLGGKKAWSFDYRDKERVMEVLRDVYGDDGHTKMNTVDVLVFLDKVPLYQSLEMFGRQILHTWGRDSKVIYGTGVTVKQGSVNSGGSRKHPSLSADKNTILLVRDVPENLLKKEPKESWELDAFIDNDKAKRIRIAKAKAIAKIKLLELV